MLSTTLPLQPLGVISRSHSASNLPFLAPLLLGVFALIAGSGFIVERALADATHFLHTRFATV
jgi:hypothetical protein